MASVSDMELKIDLKAAQDFLDMVAHAAKSKFAIVKPGDVVFLESPAEHLTDIQAARMREHVEQVAAGTGVTVVLLPRGVKVAQLSPMGSK